MSRITRYACLMTLALGACGGHEPPPAPPPPPKPQATVFDDIVNKKHEIPAAIEKSQDEHVEATKKAIDEAEGNPPPSDGAPR